MTSPTDKEFLQNKNFQEHDFKQKLFELLKAHAAWEETLNAMISQRDKLTAEIEREERETASVENKSDMAPTVMSNAGPEDKEPEIIQDKKITTDEPAKTETIKEPTIEESKPIQKSAVVDENTSSYRGASKKVVAPAPIEKTKHTDSKEAVSDAVVKKSEATPPALTVLEKLAQPGPWESINLADYESKEGNEDAPREVNAIVAEIVERDLTSAEQSIVEDEAKKIGESSLAWMKKKIAEYILSPIGTSFGKLDRMLQKSSRQYIKFAVLVAVPLMLPQFPLSRGKNEKSPLFEKPAVTVFKGGASIESKNVFIPDPELFAALSANCKRIYLFNAEKGKEAGPYIIADKPSASILIFDKSNALVKVIPAIFGRTPGEAENNSSMTDTNPDAIATTPAGTYLLGAQDVLPSDIVEFEGNILRIYPMEGDMKESRLGLHETWPKDYAKRTVALNTDTPLDNKLSWGCINISKENYEKYVKPLFGTGIHTLYITPDVAPGNPAPVFTPGT